MNRRLIASVLIFVLGACLLTPLLIAQEYKIELGCVPTFTPLSALGFPDIHEYMDYQGYSVAANPNGSRLALVAVYHLVIFNVTPRNLTPLMEVELSPNHLLYNRALAYSSDGSRLAVYMGAKDGTVILDAHTGEMQQHLDTDDDYILMGFTLIWSRDDTKLAVMGSIPGRIWEVDTGKILYEYNSDNEKVNRGSAYYTGNRYMAAWSPDGTQIALVDGAEIAILDTTTWEEVRRLSDTTADGNHSRYVTGLDWGKNGYLYATHSEQVVDVWQPDTGDYILQLDPLTYGSVVAKLSPTEKWLAIAGGGLAIMDAESLEVISVFEEGLQLKGVITNLDWLSGNRVIVYDGQFSSASIINIQTGVVQSLGHINCIVPTPTPTP